MLFTKFYYEKKLNYIYPILLYNDKLFFEYETISLSDEVIESTQKGFCKIVFVIVTEGFFGVEVKHFSWINSLVLKYGFKKENVVVLTANLIADKLYSNCKFTIITYNFFGNHLSFIKGRTKLNPNIISDYQKEYMNFIKENKNYKNFHFLCFNGVPRIHRLIIFGGLMTNKLVNYKTITSLSTDKIWSSSFDEVSQDYFYNEVKEFYKTHETINGDEILKFYENYDSTKPYVYDIHGEPRNNANVFNKTAHKNSFINIVTETCYDINEIIFFSEKIYKPIYACQPFILVGCHQSLKIFKDMGYKTFSDWWDESYDEEYYPDKKFNKIFKLIEEISKWHPVKCNQIMIEMEEVLIHNFTKFFDCSELLKLYEFLCTHKERKEKKLI